MKRSVCIVLALMLVLMFSGAANAAGSNGIQYGSPMDNDGTIRLTDTVADAIAGTGSGIVRLVFKTGNYGSDTAAWYAKYDQIVDRLRARGLTIIGFVGYEMLYGTQAQWCENNVENGGTDGYNSYIDSLGYMIGRVASHFEGKVKYWEVWNEPNAWTSNPSPGVYTGGTFIYPSNFAALLGHVYTQLKYYNQINCEVISGGLFGHDIAGMNPAGAGANYLSDTYYMGINYGSWNWILSNVGTYPLDHIGQHIYITQGGLVAQTNMAAYSDWVRDAYVTYEGVNTLKKTFITEYGWETPVSEGVSEADQATNISRSIAAFNSKSYVAGSTWFFLQDEVADLKYGIFKLTGFGDADKKLGWQTFKDKASEEGQYSDGTINSNIRNYFNNNGGLVNLGNPYNNGGTKWAHWWDYGYVQDFKDGAWEDLCVMTSSSGTFSVKYGFWDTYQAGGNHAYLKFPTNDEYAYGGGTRQDFQGGYMTWTPSEGIIVH